MSAKTHAPGVLCSFELDLLGHMRCTYVGPDGAALFGFADDPAIEHAAAVLAHVHPDDGGPLRLSLAACADSLATWRHSFRYRHAERGEIRLEAHARPVRNEQGTTLWHGVIMDVTTRWELEERLRMQNAVIDTLMATLPAAVCVARGPKGETMIGSRYAARMLRLGPGDNQSLTTSPDRRPAHFRVMKDGRTLPVEQLPMQRAARGEIVRDEELRIAFEDGSHIDELVSAAPLLDEHGQVTGTVGAAIDVTRRKAAEAALRESEHRLRRTIEEAPFPVMVHADDGEVVHLSRAWAELTGYMSEDLSTLDRWATRAFGRAASAVTHAIRKVNDPGGATQTGELELSAADGRQLFWILQSSPLGVDARGRRLAVTMAADVTARKAAESRIERLAFYDALTELPNRTLFRDRLAQALVGAARDSYPLAVLFIDLDDFKEVNDTLGHAVGDRLLVEVAARLGSAARASDTVARLGGDEFAVIQSGVPQPAGVNALAERLRASLGPSVELEGRSFQVAASLGAALYPGDARDVDDLLRAADLALYQAKAAGRGMFRLFSPALEARAQTRKLIEAELRRTLERDGSELELHFQPQLDFRTGCFGTAEALVRWRHPKRGLILPGEFIPVAEASGLIRALGVWVLRAACRQMSAWRDQGLELTVAVNLSPAQMRHDGLLPALDACLAEHRLAGSTLELEITESVLVDAEGSGALQLLEALRTRGVALAIDDFGVGYSSLGRLRQMPVQTLKMDRSFIDGLDRNSGDAALVEGMVMLGKKLGKRVVAEGVETARQLERLRLLGCDAAQGFHLARPVPAEAIPPLLAARQLRVAAS